MRIQTILFTISLLTFSTLKVKADSWVDPSWERMIDGSDVIALVTSKTLF